MKGKWIKYLRDVRISHGFGFCKNTVFKIQKNTMKATYHLRVMGLTAEQTLQKTELATGRQANRFI